MIKNEILLFSNIFKKKMSEIDEKKNNKEYILISWEKEIKKIFKLAKKAASKKDLFFISCQFKYETDNMDSEPNITEKILPASTLYPNNLK